MSASKTYRVCWFDQSRNIPNAELIEARDDQDALAQAEAAGIPSDCELWHGRRLVARMSGERQAG